MDCIIWATNISPTKAHAGLSRGRRRRNDHAEKLNLWASEIRHYNDSIEKRLDKHRLLDPPEKRNLESGTVLESADYRIEIEDDQEQDDTNEGWKIEYESPDEDDD